MDRAVDVANHHNHLWDAEHYINENWTDDNVMIRVWKFEDAPEELRNVAVNDDHDRRTWLVLVPPAHEENVDWADCDDFGTCGTDWYRLKGGWNIGVGCSGCEAW